MQISIGMILLILLVLILCVHLYNLHRAIHSSARQMTEIEKHPERNRQLKIITANFSLERLLKKVNDLYRERQQERVLYQKREMQIRREVENISHDLRTPLTSILGYIELMKDEETEPEERAEYLDIIGRRARVLQSFIQDFYEISRIAADDYPLLLEAIPVQAMLKETAVAYYCEFKKKKIEVEIDLEEKDCFITADKIQFNRILNNLMQNALRYAKNQFILRLVTKDGDCCLQFINDSDAISQEELVHIFERFYTGDQSRNSQSSGLGLTITKALVEKMKGRIEAQLMEQQYLIEVRFLAVNSQ